MESIRLEEMVWSGNLSENWSYFVQRFKNYILAIGYKAKSAEQKTSVLLHYVGAKGLEVFNTFKFEDGQETNLDVVIAEFEGYCNPRKNQTFHRFLFFSYTKPTDCNFSRFVTSLKKLAAPCEFGDLRDSLIRDRIISTIPENDLRKKLLVLETLTLEKCIEMCTAHEAVAEQAKAMVASSCPTISNSAPPPPITINPLISDKQLELAIEVIKQQKVAYNNNNNNASASSSHRNNYAHRNSYSHRNGQNFQGQGNKFKCSECATWHYPRRCPAFGKTCYHCGHKNHFGKCCTNPARRRTIESVEHQADIDSVSSNKYDILIIDNNPINPVEKCDNNWVINFNFHGYGELEDKYVPVNCKIDTGAMANVLPIKLLNSIKDRLSLVVQPSKVALCSYTKHVIPVIGEVTIKIMFRRRFFNLLFYVVDNPSDCAIIGFSSSKELGLLNFIDNVEMMNENKLANSVFETYPTLFTGIGCIPGRYSIKLKEDAKPVIRGCTKIPFAKRDKVKQAIDIAVAQHVMVKQNEPTEWVNSLSVVDKPDGSIRLCLDPRPLNKAIMREHYSMPTRDDLIVNLADSKWFSKLDANSAFWQCKLDYESSLLTTFNTPWGRYRFLRMPYGISSASEYYQKQIVFMLEGISGVEVSHDDILIHAATKHEHDKILFQVLSVLKRNNVTLNKKKCIFGVQSLLFMGEIISAQGILPDPSKVVAINNLQTPTSKTELLRFLGMVNFLARHIPAMSEKTKCLRTLLHKNNTWDWTWEHHNEWLNLKKMVTKSPVLVHYNPNKPTKVSADASRHALGAVLLQLEDNGWKPVAYASRSLSTAEQKYAQIELELLAICFGNNKFSQFLLGKRFLVESDHKPLITLFNKDLHACPLRAQRLMLNVQRFDFDIQFVPGKFLYTADVLSRFVKNDNFKEVNNVEVNFSENLIGSMHVNMKAELRNATNNDEILSELIKCIIGGWPRYESSCNLALKKYWSISSELSVHDGIVFRGNRVIIPSTLRAKFLSKLHDGHFGQNKCKSRARELMFWPGMNNDIDNFVSSCEICNKHRPQQQREPLLPHPIPKHPYDRIGIDLFACNNKDYIIITDYYSSYPEVFVLNRTTSTAIINVLKPTFARYGYPTTLVSDGAPNLVSSEFDTFCKAHFIDNVNSSAYHAQSNGMAERAVQTVKNMIIKAGESNSDIFDSLQVYRSSPLACGLSPAQLFLGRRIRGSLPIATSLLETSSQNFVRNFKKEREVYKKYFDKGTKALKPLSINERVRLYDTVGKTWNETGFVSSFDGPRSYLVKTDNGSVFKRNRIHLKPVLNSVHPNSSLSVPQNLNLSLSVSQQSDTSGQSLSVSKSPTSPALGVHPSALMNKETLCVSDPKSLSVSDSKSLSVHSPKSLSVIPKQLNNNYRNVPRRHIRKPAKFDDYV